MVGSFQLDRSLFAVNGDCKTYLPSFHRNSTAKYTYCMSKINELKHHTMSIERWIQNYNTGGCTTCVELFQFFFNTILHVFSIRKLNRNVQFFSCKNITGLRWDRDNIWYFFFFYSCTPKTDSNLNGRCRLQKSWFKF